MTPQDETKNPAQLVFAPLYKFSSAEGAAKILETCSLWAKSPLDFNDPFEVLPAFDEDRKNLAINSRKEYYGEVGLSYGGRLTPHGNEHEIPVEDFVDLQRNYHEPFYKHVYPRFRVLCFSERAEPILLWSHYAQSHSGIAIGFDVNKGDFPRGVTPNGISVNYIEDRVSLALPQEFYQCKALEWIDPNPAPKGFEKTASGLIISKSDQRARYFDAMKSMISNKYNVWNYEAERRFLYDLWKHGNGGLSASQLDSPDKKCNLVRFGSDAVTKIVFGYHCDADRIRGLQPILAGFPQASLQYVDFHPTKYEVRLFTGSFQQILSVHEQRRQGHARIRAAAERADSPILLIPD
jgi:hypothetical protein